MHLSYWEKKTWFSEIDFCIIGSGIVGLNCALQLRKKYPKAKLLVLEKGTLPQGASTKNAGFACFGSVSELLSDLESHSEEEVFDLVKQRYNGLKFLRETLGDKPMDYHQNGGYEVYLKDNKPLFDQCLSHVKHLNALLHPIFEANVFHVKPQNFGFGKCYTQLIHNVFEGQIDTGKMMLSLLKKAQREGILILNAVEVLSFSEEKAAVTMHLPNFDFTTKQLFIATNAFAKSLIDVEVSAARNQVLVTKPIRNLNIKGTFHLDRGYYYFRNINNRILLGGGRHIDPKGETTTEFGLTHPIQERLEQLLKNVILPNQPVEIEERWSGILGVGRQKKPILKRISPNIFCAVRLGGMGVAIGSEVGRSLANLVDN